MEKREVVQGKIKIFEMKWAVTVYITVTARTVPLINRRMRQT